MRLRRSWIVLLVLATLAAVGQAQPPVPTRTTTIKLTDTAGIERRQVPVEVTVRFEHGQVRGHADIGITRNIQDRRVPVRFQVLEFTTPKADPMNLPPTFVRLVFLADVAANGTSVYSINPEGAQGQPGAAQLNVVGRSLGKVIDTGPAVWETHEKSGQLLAFTPKMASDDRLVYKPGQEQSKPIHWNPGVWAPPAPAGQISDWNLPVQFDPARFSPEDLLPMDQNVRPFFYREWEGPLMYRTTRWGLMPEVAEVEASVTYTLHVGRPYVRIQSVVAFTEGLLVQAVRNAQMVFSRGQFDQAFWITRDGQVNTAQAYDSRRPSRFFRDVARPPADVAALGFYNQTKGYGIAYLVLSTTNMGKYTGKISDEQAHFLIHDSDLHGQQLDLNFVYFARQLVSIEGQQPSWANNGSLFVEDSAVLAFQLGKSGEEFDEVIRWWRELSNPLVVETD